ncbi:MAG: Rnf-Nqr domain containing protein [Planctomycetota bacterium]
MGVGELLTIALGAIFVNNIVLAKFLGLCPFFGVSKKTDQAVGMGLAVIFVMTLASLVTWLLFRFILSPGESNLFYIVGLIDVSTDLTDVLKTLSYILVIASLVQLVEMAIKKLSPALFKALGIFLPLITTNCAVLGVTLLNTTDSAQPGGLPLVAALVNGVAAGVGFLLVLVLMSGIRERLELLKVPKSLEGLPITFIATALMALAFMGFVGMI